MRTRHRSEGRAVPMRRYLDVPFADKDEAKARGARWDPSARGWFVADGIDETSVRRWWPLERKMQGPTVAVRLVMLPDSCYRCGGRVWAIVGVLLPFGTELGENVAEITDTGLFLQFDGCCEVLARALDEEWLRAHGIGPLRERWSRTAGGKIRLERVRPLRRSARRLPVVGGPGGVPGRWRNS
jgi:hypothetical protein